MALIPTKVNKNEENEQWGCKKIMIRLLELVYCIYGSASTISSRIPWLVINTTITTCDIYIYICQPYA